MLDKKRKTEHKMVKEVITPPISEKKKKIDTFNKREKSQTYNKTVYTPRSNKTDKVNSIDKSRSDQTTDAENTVNKLGSIQGTNLSNKSTRIEKLSHTEIFKDNLSVSVFLDMDMEKVYQV